MSDFHLTRELLMDLVTTDSLERLVPLIVAHLEELCPHCAKELSLAGLALDRANDSPVDYEPSIRAALEAVETEVLEKPVDSRSTGRLMALLGLPECDRCAEVRQEPAIYGRLELAERLLKACRAKLPGHPSEILALTILARCILRHTPDGPAPEPQIARETYALAMAYHGNALKILGQLNEAASLFGDARYCLYMSGSVDPLVEAEIDWLEGSLLLSQRHFRRAKQLLSRAAATTRDLGEFEEEGKTLLTLAIVERQLDNLDGSQELIYKAVECFETTKNDKLTACAWQNFSNVLCQARKFEEAREVVTKCRDPLEGSVDPLTLLRFLWVDGKIACGLGNESEGETIFQSIRTSFSTLSLPYDSALASLELAVLFLRQGRTAEVKQMVAEMVEVFDERDIHRETVASLMLFREAVELEQVSAASLREFAAYLERASRDPSHPFRQPS